MSSVDTTIEPEDDPDIVKLSKLALAAGLAGQSVTLCYAQFPAHLLSELWSQHLSVFSTSQVRHVYNQGDVRKLQKEPLGVRLALIHNPRFHVAVGWILQLLENVGGTAPVAFSRSVPADIENDPGATLVVRCTDDLLDDVVRWHRRRDRRVPGADARCEDADGLFGQLDELLGRVYESESPQCPEAVKRLRDRKLLRGLVAGAYLLRPTQDDDGHAHSYSGVLEGYEQVRGLLRRLTATTPDHQLEPLAVAMVDRANVYLGIRLGSDQSERNPLRPSDPAFWLDRQDDRPPRQPITRREIADLGNVGSTTVRQVIEFLQQVPDGFDQFVRMDLARRRPDRSGWSRMSAKDLAGLLQSWSYKQVRTHFQRLHAAGMITAERQQENGPWSYSIPEELTSIGSRFDYLPTADELRS